MASVSDSALRALWGMPREARRQQLSLRVPTNESQQPTSQPPHFRRHLQLFPHQLRSVAWMESHERQPVEVACGASRRHAVRGGILADAIGTGKTCVGLALVGKLPHGERGGPADLAQARSLIASRATLVIVPPNIWDQWNREVEKFVEPGSLRHVMAEDAAVLKQYSFRDIAEADLVVVSYRIFTSKSYVTRRRRFRQADMDPELLDTTRFPVFEAFYFHRLIADEFHELVCGARPDAHHPFFEAMEPLCCIRAYSRWGITSTPPIGTVFDVAATAAFFQVGLEPSPKYAKAFVDALVRRNTEEPARVNLVHRKVLVAQTVHERALYLLRRREGANLSDLLSYSSVHWSWSREHEDRNDTRSARDICKAKITELRRPVRKNAMDLFQAVQKFAGIELTREQSAMAQEVLWSRSATQAELEAAEASLKMAGFTHKFPKSVGYGRALEWFALIREAVLKDPSPPLRETPQAQDGQELWKRVAGLLEHLGLAYTPLLFFEQSLDESEGGVQCPICLCYFGRSDCSISRCAHIACSACWPQVLAANPSCPVCRQPVDEPVISLAVSDKRPRGASALSEFGSKVACLLQIVHDIRRDEPSAKALVFCQFAELETRVAAAFKQLAVPHVRLGGGTGDRSRAVREYLRPQGPAILLMSMAVSPSGLDLSVANHVIFMQPTWHENSDAKSVEFEAQSIGRCWRLGQSRAVYVYRLCMTGTVEEPIVDRHMSLWSSRYGALQQ